MTAIRQLTLLIVLTASSAALIHAQDAAVKTNLLYGAGTLTPNLGVELGLGRRTTLDISGSYNPWNLKGSETDNKKLVHWLLQPEFRYWLGARFSGHFFGIHALGGQYNISGHNVPNLFDKKYRYEGYAVGGGISYGYHLILGNSWGLEFTIGVGGAYLGYDKYDCGKCGDKIGKFNKTYFGPTKAGITLAYTIGGRKKHSVPPASTIPVYIPPVITEAIPELPTQIPDPAPIPEPQPTTAERLALDHHFLAPADEAGDSFKTDPDHYVNQHRDGSLSIYFRQGAKIFDSSYKNNGATMDKLFATINEIQNSHDSRIVRIILVGFASPEGSTEMNNRLAHERAVTIKNYLISNTPLTASMVDIYNGGIDWGGLRRLVAESDMYDKRQILDIIDNSPVWDARRKTGRHGELMRLQGGEPYRYMMREFFPELRNATYVRVYFENLAE